MPAATTHVEFAKDVLRTSPFLQRNAVNLQMFFLGSQGPDMLFFSQMSILPGSLHKYGNLMHHEKVWEVISFFEDYANNDSDLMSYLYGYLCHYALDSTAHPLVYARTHYLHEQDPTIHEGLKHVSLEAEIDVWLLHQRGRTINSYDVYKYLKVDSVSRKKLAQMYHAMFKNVYDLDIPVSKIVAAITEIYVWTKFISPNKKKMNILYTGEKALGSHFVTAMMLNDKEVSPIINLEHQTYQIPFQGIHSTISSSFPELYAKATTKAKRIVEVRDYSDFILNFNGQIIA